MVVVEALNEGLDQMDRDRALAFFGLPVVLSEHWLHGFCLRKEKAKQQKATGRRDQQEWLVVY